MYIRWFRTFQTSRYQGIVKATVFGVLEDLKFKISEGSDHNWSCPEFSWDSQQGRLRTTSILIRAFWNFKRKVLKYSRNCSLHSTLIPNLVKPLMYIYEHFGFWFSYIVSDGQICQSLQREKKSKTLLQNTVNLTTLNTWIK